MEVWIVRTEKCIKDVYYSQDKMFEKYPSLKEYVTETLCGDELLYAVKMKIADISDGYIEYLEDRANDWR